MFLLQLNYWIAVQNLMKPVLFLYLFGEIIGNEKNFVSFISEACKQPLTHSDIFIYTYKWN